MGSRKGHRRGGIDRNENCLSYRPGDLRDPRTLPRYSKATSSRYSVPAGSLRCTRHFLLFNNKRGPVPELTPVRSQVVGSQLATLEAGDILSQDRSFCLSRVRYNLLPFPFGAHFDDTNGIACLSKIRHNFSSSFD